MTVRKTYDFQEMLGDGLVRESKTRVVITADEDGEVSINKDYLTLGVAARRVMEVEGYPMTIRQIYYRLFSEGFINNSERDYKQVISALVECRQRGVVPWDWVEDRTRVPTEVQMWADLPDFMETVKGAYRRDIWERQPGYLECWVEKETMGPLFREILRDYGVTLNVGRGYDGWSSIRAAAERFKARQDTHDEMHILYWGDHDASGDDMSRSLEERLGFFGIHPTIIKCALTADDVVDYNLPPEPGKRTDSRARGFEEKYGELIQVELDALPLTVLRRRIREEVEDRMDLNALADVKELEGEENERLAVAVASMANGNEGRGDS